MSIAVDKLDQRADQLREEDKETLIGIILAHEIKIRVHEEIYLQQEQRYEEDEAQRVLDKKARSAVYAYTS